jgi:A/G-specific adenine glycosylase
MLQQTRVETVIPYYNRFMELFPTVDRLAEAPEEQVLKAWEGLGYYSRARNLQTAAREVVEQYGGTLPDTLEGVSGLRGIGPYTAGAILSIAYNKPEPAVDGNVMRVLSRYMELEEDIAKPATRIGIEKLAKALIPEGAAGDFNQALMELGATICTPKAAHCLPCPVMEHCGARLAGRVDELPVKAKAKPPRPERRAVALIEGTGGNAGCILVRQRPGDGLLARLWELPHVQLPQPALAEGPGAGDGTRTGLASGRGAARKRAQALAAAADSEAAASAHGRAMGELAAQLAEEAGIAVVPGAWLMSAEHIFSHIRWDMDVYRCRLAASSLPGGAGSAIAAEGAAGYNGSAIAAEGTAGYNESAIAAEGAAGYNESAMAAEGEAGYNGSAMAAEGAAGYNGSAIAAEGAAGDDLTVRPPAGADAGAAFPGNYLHGMPRQDGLPPAYRWIRLEEMDEYAFPNVFLRILNAYKAALCHQPGRIQIEADASDVSFPL